MKIVRNIPSLDLCLLEMPFEAQNSLNFDSIVNPKKGDDVFILGFPKATWTLLSAKIVASNSKEISLSTYMEGGMSGGLIFNENFKLVGILKERVESVFGNRILGNTASMAIPLFHAKTLLFGSEYESVLTELTLINASFSDLLEPRSMIAYILFSTRYQAAVTGTMERMPITDPQTRDALGALSIGLQTNRLPSSVGTAAQDSVPPLMVEVDKLWLSHLLGTSFLSVKSINRTEIFRIMARVKYRTEEIENSLKLVNDFEELKMPSMPKLVIFVFLGFVMVVMAVGWTSGYTFKAAKGSTGRRLCVMLLAHVLWPVSFAVWVLLRKLKKKSQEPVKALPVDTPAWREEEGRG